MGTVRDSMQWLCKRVCLIILFMSSFSFSVNPVISQDFGAIAILNPYHTLMKSLRLP
jgi:hypothetical protein